MPKQTTQQLAADLKKGALWPVYWIVGPEALRVREARKRIEAELSARWGQELVVEKFDASEAGMSSAAILESAQSLSLLGRAKLLIIRDAHALKEAEALRELWGIQRGPQSAEELAVVVVGLSKDLDLRKKWSKELIENAAIIECPEIKENEREAWVRVLIEKRGLNAEFFSSREGALWIAQLAGQEPWSLDVVDQELAKWEISGTDALKQMEWSSHRASHRFLQAYFSRDRKLALSLLPYFVQQADEVFPLIGLMTWNLRLLLQWAATSQAPKLNPWVADQMRQWKSKWSTEGLTAAVSGLLEVDVALKQKPLETLGVWSGFVQKTL